MKSLVILHPSYTDNDPFLAQFLLPGTSAIPCLEIPKDDGSYLTIVPSAISDTGQVSEPSEASFDGSLRVPHGAVRLIADGKQAKLLGFLAHS